MEHVTRYLTSAEVRARFGGISTMSLWRWGKDQKLGFPRPLIVNRRRFFRLDQIEAFEAHAAAAVGVDGPVTRPSASQGVDDDVAHLAPAKPRQP